MATWLVSLLADFGVCTNTIGAMPPMKLIACVPLMITFWELRMPLIDKTCGVVDGVMLLPTVNVTVFVAAS